MSIKANQLPGNPPIVTPDVSFQPFIAPETQMHEMTARAVIVGALLGMVFGASSLYLVLKVGITVSASIPVAVISITLFRLLSKLGFRDATILENNIVQTAGSAGESIAFGVGVTMPAIMILGFDLELTRVALVAILGGLLGILMMIPLRRALIVKEHGQLKYPEGTACAEVLKAGASEVSRSAASPAAKREWEAAKKAGIAQSVSARTIFTGFGIGLVYNTLMKALKLWKDTPEKVFDAPFKAGSVGVEITPELLGVGYIIGPRIASIMCAGGVLSYLVLIPMIKFFGEGMANALAPGVKRIAEMSPNDIRSAYILYIGAGSVAAGGLISLIRSLPTIWHGLQGGLRDFNLQASASHKVVRTDNDLPMKFVLIGILALVAVIWAATPLHMNLLGAILIVVFGFLFVTVSSRLTGEIGSSSNPISGMTVATLLLTCLVFLAVGWTSSEYFVTALSIGGIVCIASSNGGTTSQDLKSGFIVGSTPRLQQIAILVGALGSALILGPILMRLNEAATVYVPIAKVSPGLKTDATKLTKTESLIGPQSREDHNVYHVWYNTNPQIATEGKYLVDDSGAAIWFADPGINGSETMRPDGSKVQKFSAPKATLMSYIIKGILDRKLPWALVLLGVMISFTLEMSGIPSLAFAVGVYLPLSSSAPIFIGGLVRWFVDRKKRAELAHANLTEEQFVAETDKSPGVMLSSGYIAGGAIAGILIAFMGGVLVDLSNSIDQWSTDHNPFYSAAAWNGLRADWLAVIPFGLLVGCLYFVGREKLLATKTATNTISPL